MFSAWMASCSVPPMSSRIGASSDARHCSSVAEMNLIGHGAVRVRAACGAGEEEQQPFERRAQGRVVAERRVDVEQQRLELARGVAETHGGAIQRIEVGHALSE